MRISGFHWQDGDVYLIEDSVSQYAKALQMLIDFFLSFMKLFNLLPEELLTNSKTK